MYASHIVGGHLPGEFGFTLYAMVRLASVEQTTYWRKEFVTVTRVRRSHLRERVVFTVAFARTHPHDVPATTTTCVRWSLGTPIVHAVPECCATKTGARPKRRGRARQSDGGDRGNIKRRQRRRRWRQWGSWSSPANHPLTGGCAAKSGSYATGDAVGEAGPRTAEAAITQHSCDGGMKRRRVGARWSSDVQTGAVYLTNNSWKNTLWFRTIIWMPFFLSRRSTAVRRDRGRGSDVTAQRVSTLHRSPIRQCDSLCERAAAVASAFHSHGV